MNIVRLFPVGATTDGKYSLQNEKRRLIRLREN